MRKEITVLGFYFSNNTDMNKGTREEEEYLQASDSIKRQPELLFTVALQKLSLVKGMGTEYPSRGAQISRHQLRIKSKDVRCT